MGRPKLLLPLDGKPIVRASVERVMPHVDSVIVVTGPDDSDIRAALDGLSVTFVVNPRPADGQGSSIACGVRALPASADAVLVALGDQPRLPPSVVPTLLDVFRRTRKAVVAPVYRGTQGTPVVFAASVFEELATLGGDEGARRVVRHDPSRVELVPFDLDMPVDVDTADDYARLTRPTPSAPPGA